jgi:hypothetical protein
MQDVNGTATTKKWFVELSKGYFRSTKPNRLIPEDVHLEMTIKAFKGSPLLFFVFQVVGWMIRIKK